MFTRGLIALTAITLLAGCGSADEPSADPAPTATVTVTASPSATSRSSSSSQPAETDDPFAPSVGARALEVGDTRVGQDVRTTVLEVKRPLISGLGRTVGVPGREWMGVRVRQCIKPTASGSAPVSWSDWVAVDRQDGRYPGSGSSWDDWPTPQFPTNAVLSPGECPAGWLLVPVPKGKPIEKVILRSYGAPTSAEWLLRES